jgi:hypothetical protein
LTPEERRWLHDKYERLAAEESTLSAGRTSYYAGIGTVLITGLLIVLADLSSQPTVLTGVTTFLSLLGILISVVWAVLLHRTNDARNMWREAALRLEQSNSPIAGEMRAPITLRSGLQIQLDILRPFAAHDERFSTSHPISAMDRIDPGLLTEVLPLTFLTIWATVLAAVWIWFLFFR